MKAGIKGLVVFVDCAIEVKLRDFHFDLGLTHSLGSAKGRFSTMRCFYNDKSVSCHPSNVQSKTQKLVYLEISEVTRAQVEKWVENELIVDFYFLRPGRFHERPHISTRQYAQNARDLAISIGLEAGTYGTHSMHRTKDTQIYKKIGNRRAVQLLLGQTKMYSTVRFLGVEFEEALANVDAIKIQTKGRFHWRLISVIWQVAEVRRPRPHC